ncbi:NAC domain-containing protein 53-like [Macadamia integrifolia]|uniref:NAC domain-containing protein 53-like n=1 Tax=Macadamia integrifolia TaxID=60698 RepID=UPI001C4F58DA|nr:NAC domain-containing protein 53-like [Macadamia integrifolia]
MGGEAAVAALAPGFRFHPTDEELVSYYLTRKVCGKPFRLDAISEVDLYKSEPWDLPGQSRLKSRDQEWYFFGALDKKYGNGSRTNRATDQGYWKTTGKDRTVRRKNHTVGMKKTLVFHIGRAPRGERTNWVMHEYRLVDEKLEKAGIAQDAYVLCRIFRKSGAGPKNGEQYGAPFVEEEWDENVIDENMLVTKDDVGDDAFCHIWDEGYIQADLVRNIDVGAPSENVPLPPNFYYGNGSNSLGHAEGLFTDGQKVLNGGASKDNLPQPSEEQKFLDLPEQYQIDLLPLEDEHFVELNDLLYPVDGDNVADNPVDETQNSDPFTFPVDDGSFLEINDLQEPVEADPSGLKMLNDYLINDPLDFSKIRESEATMLDQSAFTQWVNGGTVEPLVMPQPSKSLGSEVASSSKQILHDTKLGPDVQYEEGWDNTLAKRVSRMLGSIPAPPAFAEEFPTKKVAWGQNSSMHSPSSIHVTAGVIRISDVTFRGSGIDSSLCKGEDMGLLISYGMTSGDVIANEQVISRSVGFESLANLLSGKAGSLMLRSGFYLILFWVLILSVSYKIGYCICTK